MNTTQIKITGMTCLNCVTHVQKALEAVPGVEEVRVTLGEGATVQHQGVSDQELLRAVTASGGYEGTILSPDKHASNPTHP